MSTKIEWTRNADGSEGETWNPIRARNRETGKQGHYWKGRLPFTGNIIHWNPEARA